ncbi:MAG: hypothetical protein ABL971_06050, partial [Vicinamibacterales bacterium]
MRRVVTPSAPLADLRPVTRAVPGGARAARRRRQRAHHEGTPAPLVHHRRPHPSVPARTAQWKVPL